ncbi:MAG: hypothetical protein ACREFJ_20875 [Acetobacteraceae bacterium]
MANVTLPAFPALGSGALFIKGLANGGAAASLAQYVTFGHCFQIGQMPAGNGVTADFGSGGVPCQIDVKTSYGDGSAAHALITVRAPVVAAASTTWGQFSASAASTSPVLGLATALDKTTLSLELAPTALPDWTAAAALSGGAIIRPTAGNAGGYVFQFVASPSTSGTTGTTAPTWPQTPQNNSSTNATNTGTLTDGTVTWTNMSTGLSGPMTEDMIALVSDAEFDPWLNGSLAVQGRAMTTLFDGLRVVIDLTAYADGTINADVMLANDIAMLPAAGTLCYTATLTLNGAVAFTSPELTHYQYQNWTAQVGTVPGGLQVVHSPNDFIEAQAVPPYTTTLGVDSGNYATAQSYEATAGFGEPLTNVTGSNTGGNPVVGMYMPGVGGRVEIGPNDSWTAWWFITQDPIFEAMAKECAKVNGIIPWHFWNAKSGDYYTSNDAPTFWPYPADPSGTVILTQAVSEATGWVVDQAHFPELVYLVYLAGGRRYFLDELIATSQAMVLAQWPATRTGPQNSSGAWESPNYDNVVYGEQLRGGAWTLRNAAYSYYAAPDGSSRKVYAKQVLDDNFNWLNSQAAAWTTFEAQMAGYIPSGLCCAYGNGSNMPPWQQDYFFSTVMMLATWGYAAGQEFTRWMANFIIGRFAQDISGWYPEDGIAYNFVSFTNNAAYTAGTSVAVQTWAAEEALLQANNMSQVTVTNGVPSNTWTHQAGDYGQLALNSLVGAQVLGLAGATDAYNWLAAIGSPFTDPVSWAEGPIVQMVPRTLNASQVLTAAIATNELDGTGVFAAPVASGVLVVGADAVVGAAAIGYIAAAGSIEVPTGAEPATLLAPAIAELRGGLAALQEWEATLAAAAKSAPAAAAAATYVRWEATVSAEAKSIVQALTALP